jgi:hypothetical protein
MMTPAGSLYTGKCRPGKFASAKRRARRADTAVNIRAADGKRYDGPQSGSLSGKSVSGKESLLYHAYSQKNLI